MSTRTHGIPPESSPPDYDAGEGRGVPSEFPGRLAAAAGVTALFFAAWLVILPGAAEWTGRGMRILPRLSVFTLAVSVALFLQGGWLRSRLWALGALLAGMSLVVLHCTAVPFELLKLDATSISPGLLKARMWTRAGEHVFFHGRPESLLPGVVLLLMRLECALFAAVFLGTWIGRRAWSAWHFIALLVFSALADIWFNAFRISDGAEPGNFVGLLRMPFVPAMGGLSGGPSLMDLVFISAVFESARAFRMHILSLALGAFAGYLSGSFLGLEPTPAWSHLSMPLLTFGVLTAAWPELKLDSNSVGKLFLAVALMILTMSSLVTLQRHFNPLPKRQDEPRRPRDSAHNRPHPERKQRYVILSISHTGVG